MGEHDWPSQPIGHEALERRIAKLEKINLALMNRVERSLDQQANAYSIFQTAIGLETQVRARTDELKSALDHLESLNVELTAARDASERASKVKTRFFTAVSHDVLQPLHAARLSISALIDGVGTEEHRQLAAQVDHALSSIEDLLRTMLDISKLEAGIVRPNIQPIAVRPLLNSLTVDLKPLVDAKGLKLSCHAGDVAILSDPLMIRRILQNLLANALHYTKRGGILVAARRRGADIRLEVWDSGPGIAEAERERIFEEFQRGSSSANANRGGFGLGLSIVSRMSQTLEHPLDLCSRIDHGTRFAVTCPATALPEAPRQPAAPTPPALSAIGLGASRVLVIDNDPHVLTAMQALLGKWMCDVRVAQDLDDIDALIAEGVFRPAIVLADYHLDHGILGTEAVRRVRDAFGATVPAVVITADHSADVAAQAALGGCEVLCKPIRPAELRALMRHLLG
ncbi:MAG: ATP-binding protein [Hyphomicrobiaceae bacterium]